MKKLLLVLLLASSPAWAQSKPASKGVAAVDNCAPIGRTEDGKLVYSLKCERLPAPPPPPQAEVRDAPEPEPEVRRGGLFGWSYDRR